METIEAVATTYAWIVELDLSGQPLRDTVSMLTKRVGPAQVLSYSALRRMLQEELESLRQRKPTGFVCALWRALRLDSLPPLIAACDGLLAASRQHERYVSLRGLDRLQHACCGRRALQPALELTADPEVQRRLKETY